MDFNDNASIDTSQIEDRRGQGGGGGFGGGGFGGLPGGALTAGGGGLGLLGVIVVVLLQVIGGGASGTSVANPDPGGTGPVQVSACRTGADANKQSDCRITAVANSVQAYWAQELPGTT